LGLETAQQHKEARLQAIVANKARNAKIAALFKLPLLLSFFPFLLYCLDSPLIHAPKPKWKCPTLCCSSGQGSQVLV
jgi:hypothetical protein